jgi:hypothetical protein
MACGTLQELELSPPGLVISEKGLVYPIHPSPSDLPNVVVVSRFRVDVRAKITPLFERFYRFRTRELEVSGNLNRNMEQSTLSGLGTAVAKGAMFSEGLLRNALRNYCPCARNG